jgi:GNAT superfamily N-acetyltransferase
MAAAPLQSEDESHNESVRESGRESSKPSDGARGAVSESPVSKNPVSGNPVSGNPVLKSPVMKSPDVELVELTASTPASTLDAARALLLEYGHFVIAQPGAARFCFGSLREEAEGLPASFIQQGGGSLLALVHGQPAAFVAWRTPSAPSVTLDSVGPDSVRLDSIVSDSVVPDAVVSDAWELKRLWVRPGQRGHALGARLTEAVLKRARAAGRKAVYLDTAPQSMAAAHRLYLAMGFAPCAPYNDNPVEGIVWMVKFL